MLRRGPSPAPSPPRAPASLASQGCDRSCQWDNPPPVPPSWVGHLQQSRSEEAGAGGTRAPAGRARGPLACELLSIPWGRPSQWAGQWLVGRGGGCPEPWLVGSVPQEGEPAPGWSWNSKRQQGRQGDRAPMLLLCFGVSTALGPVS